MDIRDVIAIEVMKKFMDMPLPDGHFWNKDNIAKDAYAFADAMIKARNPNE
jgi:hypothetical protein